MCGRFTQLASWSEIRDYFDLLGPALNLAARYNVAPSQDVPVVRLEEDGRRLRMMRWGLVPFWADDLKVGYRMINARAETVAEKPAFRAAFAKRRCIIPASGFFEWQPREGGKQPYYVTSADGRPLAFAGLWERWDKGETLVESCSIIVTAANDFLRSIHDRMPVILAPADFGAWLDAATPLEEAKALLRPAPDDALRFWPVSTHINKPANDDAACIEPISGEGVDDDRGRTGRTSAG